MQLFTHIYQLKLIPPTGIFCMRMYLEVIMKLILTNNHIEVTGDKHNLKTLWSKVKDTLTQEDVNETVEGVEQIVLELQQCDPLATAFRYPKKLNTLYEKRKTKDIGTLIDIRILRERFLQLYRFFDGLYDLSIVNLEKKWLYRYCPWMRGMATSQISCNNGIDKKASHVPL